MEVNHVKRLNITFGNDIQNEAFRGVVHNGIAPVLTPNKHAIIFIGRAHFNVNLFR